MKALFRFMENIDKLGPLHPELKTRCWVWTGSLRNKYGQFWYNGRNTKANRSGYILLVGSIPKGKMVLHRCDNPLCVNPDHLYLGTHLQNMEDRNSKGRQASGLRHGSYTKPENRPRGDRSGSSKHPELFRGELNGNVKLTEDQVLEIRKRYKSGELRADLAREFKVSWAAINFIVTRKLWKHLK